MTTTLDDLFARRAVALAQPLAASAELTQLELVCFITGSLVLGVPRIGLRTIVHSPQLATVAGLPSGIVGIAAFKGELTSGLDFGLWSGLGPASTGRLLAVLQQEERTLGLRVDDLVDSSAYACAADDNVVHASSRPENCILRVTQDLISVLDVPALFARIAASTPRKQPR